VAKLAESLDVSRPTVYEYLNFFEQTYLIHLVRPVSGSTDVVVRNLPKIYFGDTGILNRVAQISLGHLFENKVFNQLHTRLVYDKKTGITDSGINYYQSKAGAEIDFVVERKIGYEVKLRGGSFDVAAATRASTKLLLEEIKVVSLEKVGAKSANIIYPFDL